MASRWRVTAGIAALAAVFALKLAVLLQLGGHPLLRPEAGLDTAAYIGLARDVVRGNLALGGLYFVPPLYLYVLALLLRLWDSIIWVRLVQIAFGTAATALVFRTAEVWHGRRAAWFAAGLTAFTGVFTFYEVLLLPSALDPFLAALSLYFLSRLLTGTGSFGRTQTAFMAGLAFGAFALNRPNVLLATAGVVLVMLAARRSRLALRLAAGLVLALLPLLARNYVVARDIAPVSSHGGVNFYIGNNAQADGTYRAVDGIASPVAAQRDTARQAAERAIGRTLNDSEVSAHFYGLGWKWILDEPVSAARLFARKLAYTFNAANPAPNYSFSYYVRDEHNLLRYLPVGAWLLVPLGLAGVWIARPLDPVHRRAFWVWVSFVPCYAISVAVFFVTTRHRLPLLVPLCVTAGGAVDALAHAFAGARFRNGMSAGSEANTERTRYRLAGLALVGVFAAFAHWPFKLDEGRAEETTRMALWLIGQDRPEEAEARITQIERDHPAASMLHFRAGRAFMAKGRTDAAIRHFERARSANPGQGEIDLTLGQALLEARRPKEAIPHLRRAMETGSQTSLAGFHLARAHAAAGDRASALQVLQGVRPARSNDGESWRALGELALQLQAPRLAEAFLRQSVRVDPNFAEGHEQLGLSLAVSGRYEEAVGEFQEAVRLDPRDASANLNLAVALAETGRVEDAHRYTKEALRLDPGYERAQKFLQAIESKK